jgi:hypothetical protein
LKALLLDSLFCHGRFFPKPGANNDKNPLAKKRLVMDDSFAHKGKENPFGRQRGIRMIKRLVAATFLIFCVLLAAQQTMNNDAIIKLVKAGLSDNLILSTISASPGSYDTSANALITLKAAGVSDKIIAAILTKNAGGSSDSNASATTSSTGLPPGVDSVGVYYRTPAGTWEEISTEVVNFKSGGALKHLASVGFIKGDLNGHIGGNRSHLAIKMPASFIFYVPEGRSPGEYQLLRLRVEINSREFRSFTGGIVHETGGAIRDNVDFESKKIAPRAYQVTLGADIGKGEYGFLPPLDTVSEKNIASSGKIYSFSLVP